MPSAINIKNHKLPNQPGVYLFKDKKGKVVYVGKATNLKSRVSSYWKGADANSSIPRNRGMSVGRAIEEMLHEVAQIDWAATDSVIEALILEANLIKKFQPRYNVREKDDKSFLYVVVTKEKWPKVILVRGNELKIHNPPQPALPAGRPSLILREGRRSILPLRIRGSERGLRAMKVFGPYTNASAIRAALDLMRKWFPWSNCLSPPQSSPIEGEEGRRSSPPLVGGVRGGGRLRPCFDYHIGRCPGVCIGAISRREYMKNIRNVVLMLQGKKVRVLKNVEQEMKAAAKSEHFEEAEKFRRKLFALQHIRDVALLTKEPKNGRTETLEGIDVFGRIEGYDISNISGTNAVGSMVVFQNGEPAKS